MPTVEQPRTYKDIVGKKDFDAVKTATHHTISIAECDDDDCTFNVLRVPSGTDNEYPVTDESEQVVIKPGDSVILVLPMTQRIVLEPSNSSAKYTLSLGNY